MRQIVIHVPRGNRVRVLDIANRHGAANAAVWSADSGHGQIDMAMAWVPNHRLEALLDDLQQLPELYVTIVPRGDLPLRPPAAEAEEQVVDVKHRSPIEIFLAGLQSVGSWRSFLAYALASGIVVWIGLYTNTIYSLVAAMLIAPYAGPAMNAAIATARGDATLLGASLVRYFVGLCVAIATSAGLTLVFGLETSTGLMTDVAIVSSTTLILSLVAGAAGAVSLVQSERSSLVSGAAVGMLVAASLAPPAGIIGMYAALGNWAEAENGLYLLLNQLVGLNLSGAAVFIAYGLTARGVRYTRGRKWLSWTALSLSAVLLAGLAVWQLHSPPNLQRSDIEQLAEDEVALTVEESGLALLAEKRISFSGQRVEGRPVLMVEVYAVKMDGVDLAEAELAGLLTAQIQERLLRQKWGVLLLVQVRFLTAAF